MTRPSRDGLEPGMIVEHRQRYVVTDQLKGRLDDIKVKQGKPVSHRKRMWLRYELSEVE